MVCLELGDTKMIKVDIYKPDVLKIFCDASTRKKGDGFDVCYGAIAVVQDNIIDQVYRINSNSTNNNAEIKAIRAGVLLAISCSKCASLTFSTPIRSPL